MARPAIIRKVIRAFLSRHKTVTVEQLTPAFTRKSAGYNLNAMLREGELRVMRKSALGRYGKPTVFVRK